MKTVIILYMFILFTSDASAEIYKWEDANGIHISDNPSSIPEKYREKLLAEPKVQTKSTTPQVGVVIPPLILPAVTMQNQVAINQANLERQRRASEVLRQQQARSLATNSKNLDKAFQSLAGFMAFWLLVGFFLFIAWVSTIVDIVRSDFKSPSNKTVWMLLVIIIPPLGMMLYYIFGLSQKYRSKSSTGHVDNQGVKELSCRLLPVDRQKRFCSW